MEIVKDISTNGFIDITFEPLWEHISLTRYYLESFLLLKEIEQIKVSKIVLSVSELLENAIKYTDKKNVRLVISESEDKEKIIVHVLNYTEEEKTFELIDILNEMESYDPLSFYLKQMKSSTESRKNKSCLGLARINHEANAKIIADFKKNMGILHVRAILNFEEL